jgi:quinol monooxygenase YgiN
MIIISATLDFATQADRDRAVAISAPIQQRTRDEEAACRSYCFAADPCVPTRIQVYELWDDEPGLAAHFKHPTYAAMVEALRSVGITGTENQMYKISAHEPVYDANGNAREKFFVGK